MLHTKCAAGASIFRHIANSQMCCRHKYSSSPCQLPNVLQAQVSFVTLPIPKCAAGTIIPRHRANYQMCCKHKYLSSPCQLPNGLHAQVFLVNLPITTKQYGDRNPIWDVRMIHHLHVNIAYLKLILLYRNGIKISPIALTAAQGNSWNFLIVC